MSDFCVPEVFKADLRGSNVVAPISGSAPPANTTGQVTITYYRCVQARRSGDEGMGRSLQDVWSVSAIAPMSVSSDQGIVKWHVRLAFREASLPVSRYRTRVVLSDAPYL